MYAAIKNLVIQIELDRASKHMKPRKLEIARSRAEAVTLQMVDYLQGLIFED